jgi:hypothetical protein
MTGEVDDRFFQIILFRKTLPDDTLPDNDSSRRLVQMTVLRKTLPDETLPV